MIETNFFLLFLALLIGITIAYFQYLYKEKYKEKRTYILFTLKATSIFLLLVLLINPKVTLTSFEIIKPRLNVLADNSKSIEILGEKRQLEDFYQKIKSDKELANSFDINAYVFSNSISFQDSLEFTGSQTNISNAILKSNSINYENSSATILLTDGNQTKGFDYRYFKPKTILYPVVFGDTSFYNDLFISQVNVNKYSYVNNQFPVEVLVYSNTNKETTALVSIKNKGKTIAKKSVVLAKNATRRINFLLEAKSTGISLYTAELSKLKDEKNTINNLKNFSVEVIDDKAEVLLISDVLHPDIGALKRSIESKKNRKVKIARSSDNIDIEAYQSIIIYQPTTNFKNLFSELNKKEKNFFLIAGTNTNYSFLNSLELGFTKNYINEQEIASPIYNSDFLPFQQLDIGFQNFSPLKDVFGDISFSKSHHILLNQNVNGVTTQQPLLATINSNNAKIIVLFGEGIWQWRSNYYAMNSEFEEFDTFIGNLIQYTANSKKKDRLEVEVEPIHYSNEQVDFKTYFFDENYRFDTRANLELQLTNEKTKEKLVIPFSYSNNSYTIAISDLKPGDYLFTVLESRSQLFKKGKIKILETEIESQFLNANPKDLSILSNQSKGKLFYSNQFNLLKKELLENENYVSIQKEKTNKEDLIKWWQILFLIVLFLSAEWFLRKYLGKI